MGYRTLKMYVFSNLYMGYSYCNKRYKEVRVIAETILEAKKKVRESWQCSTIEALERKAEQMLMYRRKLV